MPFCVSSTSSSMVKRSSQDEAVNLEASTTYKQHYHYQHIPYQVHNPMVLDLPSTHGVQRLHQLPLSTASSRASLAIREHHDPAWPVALYADSIISGRETTYRAELTVSATRMEVQWLHIPCKPSACKTLELKLKVREWRCQQWCLGEVSKALVVLLNGIVHRGAMGACDAYWPVLDEPMKLDAVILSVEVDESVVTRHWTHCGLRQKCAEVITFAKLELMFGNLCAMGFFEGSIAVVGIDVKEKTAEFVAGSEKGSIVVGNRVISCKKALRKARANGIFWGVAADENEEDTLFVY